jgi:hypothetical protein
MVENQADQFIPINQAQIGPAVSETKSAPYPNLVYYGRFSSQSIYCSFSPVSGENSYSPVSTLIRVGTPSMI